MAVEARDSSEDWVLRGAARPRSFAELEARIEGAVATARASEAAVAEVGAAAIEAAEQARQAAALAERAVALAEARDAAAPPNVSEATGAAEVPDVAPAAPGAPAATEPERAAPGQEEWLVSFTHRAEALSERLVRLQRV